MPYQRPPEQRRPREYSPSYLAWIREQPCCICGRPNVEAAHLRASSLANGKPPTGLSEKSDDRWALPLCRDHHVEQHSMNEREWWASYHIDPAKLALKYQVMIR
jgi:hypothetical protein